MFIVLSADEARAATFVVNSVYDRPDNAPGDGVCEATVPASTVPGDPDTIEACTLRAAIQEANAEEGADEIDLPAGHYELNQVGANEDAAATGDLDITDTVTINGEDPNFSVVDAEELEFVSGTIESNQDPPDRVFHIHGNIDVEMSAMTIRGGTSAGAPNNDPDCTGTFNSEELDCNGGGIYIQNSNASLTITNSILRDNFARGTDAPEGEGNGGAIAVRPGTTGVDLAIEDSVLRENRALPGTGAAIFMGGQNGTFTMSGTLVEENREVTGESEDDPPAGGAVRVGGNWTADITDSSIFRNRATPGLFVAGGSDATVLGTEIAQNHKGGIVSNADGVDVVVGDGSQVTANLHNGIHLSGDNSSLDVADSIIGDEVSAVRGHAFIGNQGTGIVMTGEGSDLDVTDSLITRNHRSGIQIGGEGGEDTLALTVARSTISEHGAAGINIGSDVEGTLIGSEVIHNTVGGIWVRPFSDELKGDRNNQEITLDRMNVSRNNVRGLWVVETDPADSCFDEGGENGDCIDDPEVGAQLEVTNSTFNRNNVSGIHVMDGGAVLNLTDSTVNRNSHDYGGGIAIGTRDFDEVPQDEVVATIDGSTIAHNRAAFQGGGIWNDGDLTIVNSTISANTAEDANNLSQGGGGLYNDGGNGSGTVSMEYVTMFRNQTLFEQQQFSDGEAIYNDAESSDIQVTATIVALEITTTQVNDDEAFRENCAGADPTSNGDNIEDMNTCNFNQPSDLPNTDPDLYALRDNGGRTETHMPEPGSPAIDNDPDCSEEVDQRDQERPSGAECDTGSVEVQGEENEPTPCDADFCVNNEYDHVPDGCEPAPPGDTPDDPSPEDPGVGCTLREAVIDANADPGPNDIFVPSEDYFLTRDGANENASFTGDLDVTDTVTIDGEGPENSVVDASYLEFLAPVIITQVSGDEPPDRVLHVTATVGVTETVDVDLEGLTLQHGRATESSDAATGSSAVECGDIFGVEERPLDCRGGGILFEPPDADLTLTEVWVLENRTGNSAVEEDPSVPGDGESDGGGIFYQGDEETLTIVDSRVSANQAGDNGNGGGIAAPGDEANIDISDSEIGGEPWGTMGGRFGDGNAAGDDANGGGIWLDGVTATLDAVGTTFMWNRSSDGGSGGGIYVGGADSDVSLDNSQLIENEGGDSSGGGMFIDGNGASVDLTNGSDVLGNVASDAGGGIFVNGGGVALSLSDLSLSGNQASDSSGGGIFLDDPANDPATLEMSNVTVRRNKADGDGGAIFSDAQGEIDVTESTFEDNNADDEGGVVTINGGTVGLTDTAFLYNKSADDGGAINNDGGLLEVTRAEFFGNKADNDGGAITNDSGLANMVLKEVEFAENVTESDGGAVDNEGSASLEDVWFTYNSAQFDGGGWSNDSGATLEMDGVAFSDNRAGEEVDNPDLGGAEQTAQGEQHPGNVNCGGHGFPEEANGNPEGAGDPSEGGEGGPPEGKGPPEDKHESEGECGPEGEGEGEEGDKGSGGGLFNAGVNGEEGGTVSIINTTFSRNEDEDRGGGIYNDGDMTLHFSTLYDHETDLEERDSGGLVPGEGVAIFNNSGGSLEVFATIVAYSEGENCQDDSEGGLVSLGFNIEDQDTCNFTDPTDQVETDPEVGQLRDNGGPGEPGGPGFTPTHLPQEGSPAIDNVPDDENCPPVDQRNFERPFGPDCDTGAVEVGAEPEPSPSPTEDGDGGGGGAPQPDLDVSPEDADNTLPGDDSHTLEADVEDDEGDPVDFKIVSGPNAAGGDTADFSCDPAGDDATCEVTYTSDGTTGTDEICGWVDSDNDNVFDPGGDEADGGDCDEEELGEEESNDETDVVEKGWTEASPSPSPAASCNGQPATHAGTPGNDTIVGTNGDDVIQAFAGNDTIRGRGGDDVICAGAGNDNDARGGSGNDLILLGTGNDLGLGNSGNDRIRGEAGDDRARGGSGNDIIRGGRGDDTLGGNRGADRIFGGGDDDLLKGRAGRDLLAGRAGSDTIRGGANADTMRGNQGADLIQGGGGNDLANGRRGFDTVEGGNGRDRLRGGRQADVIRGQAGNDRLRGDEGDDTLRGGTGNDDLKGLDGDDLLNGGPNFDTCGGGPGADTIINCEA